MKYIRIWIVPCARLSWFLIFFLQCWTLRKLHVECMSAGVDKCQSVFDSLHVQLKDRIRSISESECQRLLGNCMSELAKAEEDEDESVWEVLKPLHAKLEKIKVSHREARFGTVTAAATPVTGKYIINVIIVVVRPVSWIKLSIFVIQLPVVGVICQYR